MQKRITIDVDNFLLVPFIIRLYKIFIILPKERCVEGIVYRRTKRGYHLIIWLCEPVINKRHLELREWLKDDINRVKFDRQRIRRGEPIQILFYKKFDLYYKRTYKKPKAL